MRSSKYEPRNGLSKAVFATVEAKSQKQSRLEAFILLAFLILGYAPEVHNKMSFSQDGVWNQVIWASFYVFAFFRLFSMRVQALNFLSRSLPLVSFCTLMLVSAFWSVAPSVTLIESIELAGSAMIGLYVVLRFPISSVVKILLLKFFIVAVASFAVIVLAPGRGREDWGAGAWSGILPDKNSLGASMALALVLLVSFSPKSGRERIAVVFAAVLFSILLLGSKSTTAVTSCVASIGTMLSVLVLRSKNTSNAVRIGVFTTITMAALGLVIANFQPDSLLGLVGKSSTLTGRTDFWPYLQQAIADRPLLGFGYGAFFGSSIGADYLSTYVVEAGGWHPFHAHNSFFQIALDAGYVGVALFAVALGVALFRAIKLCFANPTTRSIFPLSIILYLMVSGYTETSFAMYNTDLWILFICAAFYPLKYPKVPKPKSVLVQVDNVSDLKRLGRSRFPA